MKKYKTKKLFLSLKGQKARAKKEIYSVTSELVFICKSASDITAVYAVSNIFSITICGSNPGTPQHLADTF